jgi:hypothetical protein
VGDVMYFVVCMYMALGRRHFSTWLIEGADSGSRYCGQRSGFGPALLRPRWIVVHLSMPTSFMVRGVKDLSAVGNAAHSLLWH